MINYDKHSDSLNIMCDECDDDTDYFGSFQECIQDAKDDGWRIYKDDYDEWKHMCPCCNQKDKDPTEVFK